MKPRIMASRPEISMTTKQDDVEQRDRHRGSCAPRVGARLAAPGRGESGSATAAPGQGGNVGLKCLILRPFLLARRLPNGRWRRFDARPVYSGASPCRHPSCPRDLPAVRAACRGPRCRRPGRRGLPTSVTLRPPLGRFRARGFRHDGAGKAELCGLLEPGRRPAPPAAPRPTATLRRNRPRRPAAARWRARRPAPRRRRDRRPAPRCAGRRRR